MRCCRGPPEFSGVRHSRTRRGRISHRPRRSGSVRTQPIIHPGVLNGIAPDSLPFNVVIAQNVGGAYHYGCLATDIYCDSQASPLDPASRFPADGRGRGGVFRQAEPGWNCGGATARDCHGCWRRRFIRPKSKSPGCNGRDLAGWQPAQRVNRNAPTDQDAAVNGLRCPFPQLSALPVWVFLNLIVGAAAPTLAKTYKKLTGKKTAFPPFKALLGPTLSAWPTEQSHDGQSVSAAMMIGSPTGKAALSYNGFARGPAPRAGR